MLKKTILSVASVALLSSIAVAPNQGSGSFDSAPQTASAATIYDKVVRTEYKTTKATKFRDKASLSGYSDTIYSVSKGTKLTRASSNIVKTNGKYYVHVKFKGKTGYVPWADVEAIKVTYHPYVKYAKQKVGTFTRSVNVRADAGAASGTTIKKVAGAKQKVTVLGYRKVNSKKYYYVTYKHPATGETIKGFVFDGYVKLTKATTTVKPSTPSKDTTTTPAKPPVNAGSGSGSSSESNNTNNNSNANNNNLSQNQDTTINITIIDSDGQKQVIQNQPTQPPTVVTPPVQSNNQPVYNNYYNVAGQPVYNNGYPIYNYNGVPVYANGQPIYTYTPITYSGQKIYYDTNGIPYYYYNGKAYNYYTGEVYYARY